jgi:hypothetical protein
MSAWCHLRHSPNPPVEAVDGYDRGIETLLRAYWGKNTHDKEVISSVFE